MFPASAIDLLFAVLWKDLTVVQKLVLGNWSTVVLSPSVDAATPSAASRNFLHVVETPSAVSENILPVVETPSAAFENFFLVAEALSTAAAYLVHQLPLRIFFSFLELSQQPLHILFTLLKLHQLPLRICFSLLKLSQQPLHILFMLLNIR